MRRLTHITAGEVSIDVAGLGHVDLWIAPVTGSRLFVGQYEDEATAIGDLEREALQPGTQSYIRSLRGVPWTWLITSSAPGERLLPVFDSDRHDAAELGYAATRASAAQLAGGRVIAYRAEECGPGGLEAWTAQ